MRIGGEGTAAGLCDGSHGVGEKRVESGAWRVGAVLLSWSRPAVKNTLRRGDGRGWWLAG